MNGVDSRYRDRTAEFRFYGPLNDFLPGPERQRPRVYRYRGCPAIKDPIEALGVPHTEVELILVEGRPVDFHRRLQPGDRVAVYPPFLCLTLAGLPRLRDPPPDPPRFVIDVNLGRLARRLRWLGFDCLYRNDYRDPEIVAIAATEGRIVLTRDRRLLHARAIAHGYWVRSVNPEEQQEEVARRYGLAANPRAGTRCLVCNGGLVAVDKAEIRERLEPKTRRYYRHFLCCTDCHRLYWEGSHVQRMRHPRPAE